MKQHPRELEPLLVTQREAMRLLGIKNTKFFELKRAGLFETVELGNRSMVRYASLERLAEPKAA